MKHLLLSLFISATAAVAGPEQLLHAGLLSPEIIQQIKPELGLTAEQESKMTALISEAKAKGSGTESALKEQQKTLQQMLRDPATTVETASDMLGKVLASGVLRELEGGAAGAHDGSTAALLARFAELRR